MAAAAAVRVVPEVVERKAVPEDVEIATLSHELELQRHALTHLEPGSAAHTVLSARIRELELALERKEALREAKRKALEGKRKR